MTVLITNRGDFTVRALKTCRRLGMRAITIYTESDRESLPVKLADEAHLVSSYWSIEEIVAVALKTGCDIVHPGYGFLAESADFARRCTEAGLVFVGPSADVIAQMANKINARRAASAAGISVLKGTEVCDPADMLQEVERLGMIFPVMLKAASGGGGLAIEIVESKEGLVPAVERLQRLAQMRFGDPAIYAEEYLLRAKHIEVQIFADQHGNVFDLGERECSLQRRHQKLVEESPSLALTSAERRRICTLARKFARVVGYTGIGTIEFLFDPRERTFYFLEMNTRIQVEHVVTEMLVGIDLVELQFRIAAGEHVQHGMSRGGHALQVRLYPEGLKHRKFVAHPGAFALLELPREDPEVRFETVLELLAKDTPQISVEYQNLLARVIVWAPTRKRAIGKMDAVLSELRITLGTNIPFLRALLRLHSFEEGTHHVQTLEDPQTLYEVGEAVRMFAGQEGGHVLFHVLS